MATVLQEFNQQQRPRLKPLKTCTSGPVPGSACAFQRAATLASNERKVFILHDDGENATAARLRTVALAKLFDASNIVTYYRNARHKAPLRPSDHVESLRMSWSGKDNNDVLKAASFVRYTIHSKGPFVALIGLGEARHVLQLVAREHDLMETSPDPDLLPNSGPYPITILTPTLYTTFYIVEPEPFSEDVFAPFPTTVLPNNAILSIVQNVIASGKKMFDRPIMPLAELRAAKLTRRAILLAAAKQKEEDVNAWKELKRRKEMGEDVELPERPISGRQRRRREKMEKRMAEIWGDEESPNQEYPSNLFEVAPVPKPAEVFQSSEISDKISNYVLQPTAEPVVTCEVNLLNEMIQWLEKDEDIVASQEPRIDFVRGSILGKTTVGGGTSVDLCKQVVGPKGIKPILDAVAKNSHIDRFLLGNNIVGDEGAKVIADFIRDEKSKRVYNFYIAGNSISPVGIGEIANALCTNTTVTALWLKRNPLLTEGAKHLANMLSINTTLQTLDLVNTGILDAGIISLMQSLKQNPASGLRHLYLGSNAESAVSGHAIGSYLRSGFSRLTSLFCSSSRLGDEGIVAIAEGLKGEQYMERLGFESARCGDVGAKALADALEHHPRIVFLDLGFRKGTYEMGEQPNRITDEGLMYLGDKLIGRSLEERAAKKNTLKWLDVVQNAITKQGAADFVRAFVVGNTQLLQVRLQQKGLERNLEVEKTTKRLARENKEQYFVDNGLSDAEYTERARVREALEPQHISEIYSVYRGNM